MEGSKQEGSSSSSLPSEIFGSQNTSSSLGIFGSIFSPPSKAVGREILRQEGAEKTRDFAKEGWNSTSRDQAVLYKPELSDKSSTSEKENRHLGDMFKNPYYQQERVPCHLSSSIYYGGQDIYSQPSNTESNGLQSAFKKDGGEDDGKASRGNWWEGSLYY